MNRRHGGDVEEYSDIKNDTPGASNVPKINGFYQKRKGLCDVFCGTFEVQVVPKQKEMLRLINTRVSINRGSQR